MALGLPRRETAVGDLPALQRKEMGIGRITGNGWSGVGGPTRAVALAVRDRIAAREVNRHRDSNLLRWIPEIGRPHAVEVAILHRDDDRSDL